MSNQFTGFESGHFDAYEERKWRSNRFNLERMKVRELVEALWRPIIEARSADGVQVTLETTQDHPTIFNQKCVDSQWGLMIRTTDERRRIQPLLDRERTIADKLEDPTIQHRQVVLAARVDLSGLQVTLRLHQNAHLDLRNTVCKFAQLEHVEAFVGLLAELPDSFRICVGDADAVTANKVTAEQASHWSTTLEGDFGWFMIGVNFERTDPVLESAEFAAEAQQVAERLWPVYRFMAWSSENDFVDGEAFLKDEKKRAEERAAAPAPAPAETNPAKPEAEERPSTRGGWSYRPNWVSKTEPGAQKAQGPKSPSSKVRQRAAEAKERLDSWSYSGPSRAPSRPEGGDDRRSGGGDARRSGGGDDRRSGGGDARRSGGGDARRSGGGERGNRGDSRPGQSQDRNERHSRHDGRPGRPPNRNGDKGARGGRYDTRRDNKRGSNRGGGPKSYGQNQNKRAPRPVNWVDSDGPLALMDHARVTGGLFDGRVGQIVEINESKGRMKVVIGDMAFEVSKDNAVKVVSE